MDEMIARNALPLRGVGVWRMVGARHSSVCTAMDNAYVIWALRMAGEIAWNALPLRGVGCNG
ncbi:MAG: hypothetical protein H5T63_09790 [Chloroflexi bacterium]|nr:hypothetical protein [Chloroflexota bacterium]